MMVILNIEYTHTHKLTQPIMGIYIQQAHTYMHTISIECYIGFLAEQQKKCKGLSYDNTLKCIDNNKNINAIWNLKSRVLPTRLSVHKLVYLLNDLMKMIVLSLLSLPPFLKIDTHNTLCGVKFIFSKWVLVLILYTYTYYTGLRIEPIANGYSWAYLPHQFLWNKKKKTPKLPISLKNVPYSLDSDDNSLDSISSIAMNVCDMWNFEFFLILFNFIYSRNYFIFIYWIRIQMSVISPSLPNKQNLIS